MQDQFKQTYFEECEDRIQEAEEGLTLMLDGQLDSDTVNQVFRGIHSIKGGAGAFSFERIVTFSHEFETVLDFVREGKLSPDREMCTLFLRANDVVADMLSKERSGLDIPESLGKDLLVALQSISAGVKGEAPPNAEAQTPAKAEATAHGKEMTWSITFRPHQQVLKTGNEPLFILQALSNLGSLQITTETDGLPSLNDLNPELCYIGWRLLLKTAAPHYEIHEVSEGQKALGAYQKHNPDVVFLDIHMPVKSGLDVVNEIFECDFHAYIVMLSADRGENMVLKAIERGAAEYIAKPPQKEKAFTYLKKCVTISKQ